MIKNILAIGDSFTAGAELSDPVNHSWPTVLANKLNCEVTNLGLPGGSNDRVFRLAVERTLAREYDIVICGWTNICRLDLVYQGKEFPVTSASTWHHEKFPWLKEYYAYFHDDEHAYHGWLTKIIALQGYFKYKNQQYLFVNMQGSNGVYEKFNLKNLTKQIDSTYYPGFENDQGMTVWQGDCPKGSQGHPLELGHERIADKIYEHIRHLGWIS